MQTRSEALAHPSWAWAVVTRVTPAARAVLGKKELKEEHSLG